jgi:hypothetical protein
MALAVQIEELNIHGRRAAVRESLLPRSAERLVVAYCVEKLDVAVAADFLQKPFRP